MASKICMNGACGATSSFEWRKGWRLRSGGFANLCDNCGCAYEKLVFCEAFHSKESGWRECNSCGKRLHCGCVASKDALVILDNGGVECLHCARTSGLSSIPRDERPYKFGTSAADNVGELPSISVDNTVDGDGCHILPKPLKMGSSTGLEGNKDILPHIRVARPPAEGRVRSQLLPRYWPKITDQELQQISGDSNSTIVPLFEKVLSASDAGRIGRLVLPKACAEAYFPPISQPEGLQLKIQDVKGKDWVFQFRFWPNNNSRMYVLEGVTPCIQSMQLQAGDTVTFSRIYPEGKLVMGFRKASNSIPMQGSTDPHLSALSEHLSSADVDIGSHKNESLQLQPTLDPPPIVKPSIMVEDQEFEEYKEPPVVGKRTIFTARSSGEQDQWARCDGCSKWRRLPVDALLPPKWTCAENSWDPRWSSCSAPSEMSPKELENLLRLNMDFKKQRNMASHKSDQEQEPSGLDALATAAVLGDSRGNSGMPSVAKTTRHPRHRPGCTCIVCIQPPSGKGPKHEPTCTCNVCMTVKRRFKTLMHKKKRDSEPECEAEITQRKPQTKDEAEIDSASRGVTLNLDSSDNEARKTTNSEFSCGQNQVVAEKVAESGKGQMDLAVIQTAKKTSKQGQ